MDVTRTLAEWVYNLKYCRLPQKTITNIKFLIVDYLSSALAGYRTNKEFNCAVEKIIFGMGGREESTVLFHDERVPCENAAFLNAVYAHGADMDDGNRNAMGHVGAHVMSAVFALADAEGSDRESVFEAIVCGYEVYCRVAAAAQPGLVKRGFHSTGTAGVIGCAAACAKLLKLDQDGIYNAMSISVTQASGLMIVAQSGQECKGLNPANAAKNGIISAKLSMLGVRGFFRPLEGCNGWFYAMNPTIESIMLDIKEDCYALDECYTKPYPSCRHTHGAIESCIYLKNKYGFTHKEVERVNVYIYENAINVAGKIIIPDNCHDKKFSIHYAVAASLIYGGLGLELIENHYVDDEEKNLIEKINLISTPEMEDREKGIRGTCVEIITKDGKCMFYGVKVPKGDPESPFTFEDVKNKLRVCSKGIWDEDKQNEVLKKLEL